MSTRPYPSYKDSGVEWLGRIPAQWRALKIKRLSLVKRGASPRPIDDPIFFSENGAYAWVRISDVTASTKYLLQTYERLSELGRSKSVALEPGELFLSIAATVGKPIITKIKCCIHDGFVYFVGLKENREFLYWLFSSGGLYQGLGKLGTQLNLNTDTIGDIRIPIPPSDEQTAIASFLDQETGRIDALVKKKERLLELLREKRTALISHAVTQGLDPNVPQKDSGIPWLGRIPAQWSLRTLKHTATFFGGGTPSKDNLAYWAGDIPWVSPKDMKDETVNDSEDHITPDAIRASATRMIPSRSVLLVVRSGILKHTIPVGINSCPVALNQDMKAIVPKIGLDSNYLAWFFRGLQSVLLLEWRKAGATVESLEHDLIARTRIPCPDEGEQQAIAGFLDRETGKIDALVKKKERLIERLREYRTALISAAVTGQIDVRNHAAAVGN